MSEPRPTPDFSPLAERYARARPDYPREWFEFLASLLDRHELAWDAATGSGQAARGLVDHFDRVVATDISAEQIGQATPHPRIEYRVAPSERSGLPDGCVDLVTSAAAVHWFDPVAFNAEVERVTRPGGVLAVWTYHVGILEPPFDRVFATLYHDVVRPYFGAGARLVDARYATLDLPGQPLHVPEFLVTAHWNLSQAVAFIHSWSGTARYVQETGKDPVDAIAAELRSLWGSPERILELRWPIFARVSRL
jgi:SAM-dependent methyltransferase